MWTLLLSILVFLTSSFDAILFLNPLDIATYGRGRWVEVTSPTNIYNHQSSNAKNGRSENTSCYIKYIVLNN